jgi:hypothetical protein
LLSRRGVLILASFVWAYVTLTDIVYYEVGDAHRARRVNSAMLFFSCSEFTALPDRHVFAYSPACDLNVTADRMPCK